MNGVVISFCLEGIPSEINNLALRYYSRNSWRILQITAKWDSYIAHDIYLPFASDQEIQILHLVET